MPVLTKCDFCKNEYFCKPYKLKLKSHFCSKKCHHASMEKTEYHECLTCHKIIKGKPTKFRSKTGKTFCNRKCAARWRSLNPTRIRFTCGIKDYQREIYGLTCLFCGFNRCIEYAHLIPARDSGTVHPDNIIAVCPNHHTLMDRNLLNEEENKIYEKYLDIALNSPYSKKDLV